MTQRMRMNRRAHVVLLMASLIVLGIGLLTPQVAHAASTGGCNGARCNGRNPAGLCDGDAITVAAMTAQNGMLELRYSPSCHANWGRYTPYWRTALWDAYAPLIRKTIYARVTVWNPGGTSYGDAYSPTVDFLNDSTWTYMTNGTQKACTGVEEVLVGDNADTTSLGWKWGPCY